MMKVIPHDLSRKFKLEQESKIFALKFWGFLNLEQSPKPQIAELQEISQKPTENKEKRRCKY